MPRIRNLKTKNIQGWGGTRKKCNESPELKEEIEEKDKS